MSFLDSATQPAKVANHPFAIMLLPIKRCPPILDVHFFPSRGMPPAKVLVPTIVDEVEIITDTYGRAINREIFQPNFMRRFLVVPSEPERTHRCLRITGILAGAFKS